MKAIRSARVEKKNWKKQLLRFLLSYCSTPHQTTGETSFQLLMNRGICAKLPKFEYEPESDVLIHARKHDKE